MNNRIKRIIIAIMVCLLTAGLFACAKEKPAEEPTQAPTATPTQTVTATPEPTKEPTPEPTEEPTPEPTPIPSARDSFEKTGFAGGYYLEVPDEDWSYGEVIEVGGRLIVVTLSFGMPQRLYSIDPVTKDIIKLDLSENYCYSGIFRINDELFAMKNDYYSDGDYEEEEDSEYRNGSAYIIYDKYLRNDCAFKGDAGYENAYFCNDGETMWRYSYNDGNVIKRNYRTGEETVIEALHYTIDSESNNDLIMCTQWDEYDGLAGRVIYDTREDRILTCTTQENNYWITESDDHTGCAVVRTKPYYAIEIYDCEARQLLGENGELLREPVSVMQIADSSEINYVQFDWVNRYVITDIDAINGNTSYHAFSCYSMEDGRLISSYDVKENSDLGGAFAVDSENGLVYIVSSDELNKNVRIVAWDYMNDDAYDTYAIYDKQTVIPDYIEEKRAAFEKKHGFILYLGSEVFASDYSYQLTLCNDWNTISETIDVLDEVLGQYPEGFFEQIRTGKIKTLAIYLCGGFTKVSEYSADNAIALATSFGYEQALAIDVNYRYCLERTIVHEISHWIDSKIERAGSLGICPDYEEEWLTHLPSDYTYKYSYVSGKTIWKYIYGSGDEAYFVDEYSQTYPGEDRARCFEYLMYPDYTAYMESPHIREKLHYYFSVIRQVFDDTGWPEETSWELKLREADEGKIGEEEGNVAETDSEGQG